MSAIPQTPPELSSAATSLDRRIQMLRTAMGPVIAAALADPDVVEIMLNPDRTLWVDRLSSGRMPLGVELSQDDGERIIRLVAAHVGAEVHRGRPLLTAELPETGERFEGILPPAAPGPAFALRKRAVSIIGLDRYVADGILTTGQAEFLRRAVRERQNILIAGATSSGKTTLANALLAEIAATGDRVLVLEDTIELQCAARDHVPLRTRAGVVSMQELVRATMRLRPDRVVVGEVRGAEALDHRRAAGQIQGVRDRRGEDEEAADQHQPRVAAELQIVHEGQPDAGVGEEQCADFAPADRLAHEQHADQQCQRRVGEDDQPLEAGRDVLQADEVEDARAVVAEHAERGERQPLAEGERWRRSLRAQRHPDEDRQCEQHAQREQRHRVDRHRLRHGVGELDENRLEREAERRNDGECDAEALRRPVAHHRLQLRHDAVLGNRLLDGSEVIIGKERRITTLADVLPEHDRGPFYDCRRETEVV